MIDRRRLEYCSSIGWHTVLIKVLRKKERMDLTTYDGDVVMHGGYLTDQVRVRVSVRLTNSSLSICRKRTNYKCLIIKLQYITEDVDDKKDRSRDEGVCVLPQVIFLS